MRTLIDYVNDLFRKFGSDYKIEKELGLAKGAVYKIKHRQQCGKKTAIKIADALGIDREEVLFAATIARAKLSKEALEKFSRNAALTMNSFMALGVMRPALNHVATAFFDGVKCILCKIGHSAKNRFFTYTEKSNSERISHGFLFIAPGSWFNDW